jgi:hypothetical protein
MDNQPKLQKPGAGLPLIEGLMARFIFYPSSMRKFNWNESLEQLRAETEKIIALVQPLTETQFKTPILIDRLVGLEDSSRYWSCALTIEHLMITMQGMTALAVRLARGESVPEPGGTAAVKPKGANLPLKDEQLAAFRQIVEKSVTGLTPIGATASDTQTAKHPFFGKIPAKGWVFVLGAHQKLHRVQIERIIKGLRQNSP